MVLVELATAAKTEFEQIRRFSFAGERGGWIAMHRYTPEGQKTKGSDLILRELSSGDELNTGNVAEFAFDKKGNWMAFAIDAAEMAANGVQLRNMSTGAVMPLDSGKASYQSLTWTENGDGLAVLRGVEDKAFEDKLCDVVGFKNLSASAKPEKFVFDLKTERNAPPNMTMSPNRAPFWTKSLSAIVFGIHEVKTKKEKKGARKRKARPRRQPPMRRNAPIWFSGTGSIRVCSRCRKCSRSRTRTSASRRFTTWLRSVSCGWPTKLCAR
ncbi:MAG: hypothetical protein FJW38_20150 [Acidobacteria bacterium]|nr:hypothetical protein [Acidobacteriota bacterium]